MNNFLSTISKFTLTKATEGEPVSLMEELENLSNGKYKEKITACRELLDNGDKVGYKKSKALLPALTISGEFNGSHKKENLKTYSQYIIIDIDALEKNLIENIKERLFQDKYVAAIWISPSGQGLKILVKVGSTAEEHKTCFDILVRYLTKNYEIEIDKSGSDICRLCFVSFDEQLLMKVLVSEFNYKDYVNELLPVEIKTPPSKIREKQFVLSGSHSDNFIFNDTRNKNKRQDRDTMDKILRFLKKNNLSITSNYDNWFRIACAIANSFTYELGKKYYLELCRLDGDLHDEYKSQNLLEYCYRNRREDIIDFSTIVFLAKQKNFTIKRNPVPPSNVV